MEQKPHLTIIYWDYENVRFNGYNIDLFLKGLETLQQEYGGSVILKCFSHWNTVADEIQLAIQNAGFELAQIPQTKKNAVDQAMIISAVNLSYQLNFSNFILISADGDFTSLCHDLQKKGINISIISRNPISTDLLPYAKINYSVSPEGIIFRNEHSTEEELKQLLLKGLSDAYQASQGLLEGKESNISIFSKYSWKGAYYNYEKWQVSPFVINQIMKLEDFYYLFLSYYKCTISQNKNYFQLNSSFNPTSYQQNELDTLFSKIPRTLDLKIPIQILTGTDYLALNTKVYEKSAVGINKMNSNQLLSFDQAIFAAFLNLIENSNQKKIDLGLLYNEACSVMGIKPAAKIYKKAGYASFKKMVKALQNKFPRPIHLKTNKISW